MFEDPTPVQLQKICSVCDTLKSQPRVIDHQAIIEEE